MPITGLVDTYDYCVTPEMTDCSVNDFLDNLKVTWRMFTEDVDDDDDDRYNDSDEDDQDVANTIVSIIENKGEGKDCRYGVLCSVTTAQLITEERESQMTMSYALSEHRSMFNDLVLLITTLLFPLRFMLLNKT